MIEPVIDESEWLVALSNVPVWDPSPMPLLIVAPHPDDETLGAGGLIAAQRARGVPVSVAAVTDGERGYPEMVGLAELRRKEQEKALVRLGVAGESITRFGLPDSNVTACERDLVERLTPLVSENTHVIAPWVGDFHPDHQACGRAAERVARDAGALITFYFFWTWHFGTVAHLHDLKLLRFPLSPDLLTAKTEALNFHGTQLVHEGGEPVLPERLLLPARRPFEVFAAA